jgi:glycerol kinase
VYRAIQDAGIAVDDLLAIGITGQRATTIIWERATGKALGPAVIWQDQRGAQRAQELVAQGFFVNAITPASKMESILASIPGGHKRMLRGELAWGNVDSFLAWRLSGGGFHATDCSNACATGYFDLFAGDWNPKLIETQGLDLTMFPALVDTAGSLATTTRISIGAIIGDQQSAAYGQGCLVPGEGKVTFGTSGTCNINTGQEIMVSALLAGAYPLVLWRRAGETVYCLEGMVITAGAVFEWLARGLGLIENPAASASMAAKFPDSHGVYFLPALQGLGSPHAQPERHAFFGGLTSGAQAPHFVRAAMEGVAFRVREMLDRLYEDPGLARPALLKVDGGAAANDLLMQIQANVLGCPVERMNPTEATAYGAALLAGEACGIWDEGMARDLRQVDRVFESQWSEDERQSRFSTWRQACGLEPS